MGNPLEHTPKVGGTAGDGSRTERGDAVPWQSRRNFADRIARIEGVMRTDAVDVHVDESWNDITLPGIDDRCAAHVDARLRFDPRYCRAFDEERSVR
jgi:hypothetical protein